MIGVLCGLRSEAKIADRMSDAVMVGCSAARRERAQALVDHMIRNGATRLMSFGLCGGVSPELEAGDLLLATSVMTTHDAWEADTSWYAPLIEALPRALCVSLWGGDRLAARAEDKALIYRRTGCMAVDMESHIVARAAYEAGLPFNVIRAVSDTADMDLPAAALVPLMADGGVDSRAVWGSIKKEPRQIPDLIRLGLGSFRAHRALAQAVAVVRVGDKLTKTA